jgi:hypothetical protein
MILLTHLTHRECMLKLYYNLSGRTTSPPTDYVYPSSFFTGMPLPLVWAWRGFASLLSASPGAMFTTVTDASTGRVVGLFMEFRQVCCLLISDRVD